MLQPRPCTFPPPPLVAGALIVCALAAPLSAGAAAGVDTEPPLIEIETLPETRADRSQVFTAQVVDDRALEDVVLYHRREGQQPYARAPMRAIADSAYFSVAIPTDPTDLRAIEYYVQARDRGGNRSVSGFAFDPLRRTLSPQPSPLAAGSGPSASTAAAQADDDARTRPRWWAIALGVVAVGALAAFADGSDDDGGDGARLTIDLQEPRTP